MIMTGQRGWRVIRGGLGAGAALNATTRGTGTGTSTATQTILPARGAQYQTVVPQRVGTGMRTSLPAGRLPSAGTQPATSAAAAQGQLPPSQINLPGSYATPTPSCPVGTTYDPTTGACLAPTTTVTYWPWIVGGAVVVVIILLAARRK